MIGHAKIVKRPVNRCGCMASRASHSLTVAIATILLRQSDDVLRERLFVIRPTRHLALCRSMLPQHPAYPSLGHPDRQISSQKIDAAPPPRGA